MPLPRLLRSIAILVAVHALPAAPWPGLGRGFTSAYARVTEHAMARILPTTPSSRTTFRASLPGDRFGEWDLLIRFPVAGGATSVHGVSVQLRRICYVPLAFLIALAVAFPARKASRLWVGACGGLAVVAGFQIVGILSVFTARGVLSLGLPIDLGIGLGSRVTLEAPSMVFAIPTLVWALLARPFDGLRPPSHAGPRNTEWDYPTGSPPTQTGN